MSYWPGVLVRHALPLRSLVRAAVVTTCAVAVAPAAAGAEVVTLGAANPYQTTVGPVLAGSEVAWGEVSPAMGRSRSQLSVLAALPGSHGSALFSAHASSLVEEDINPIGLLASATRVGVAYRVENTCSLPAFSCSIQVLHEAAFSGPLAGPLAQVEEPSLFNVDGALAPRGQPVTGSYVAAGESEPFASSVAGSYVASWTRKGEGTPVETTVIAVSTVAGTPVYSLQVPASHDACMADLAGVGGPEGGCSYALDADGTLAFTMATGGGYALYWASPAQPQLHRIAVRAVSPVIAIADDEIVYLAPVGAKGAQLAITDLNGNTRPVSVPVEGGASQVSGIAFDGASIAWAADCIYGGSVPTSAPTARPAPACEVVNIRSVARKVGGNGRVSINLGCRYSPCSGLLTLTTAVKSTTGAGKRKKIKWTTVTIATGQFTSLAVASKDSVSLKLNASGLTLLKRSGHLNTTLTAKVPDGSISQKTSETASLQASRPGKR